MRITPIFSQLLTRLIAGALLFSGGAGVFAAVQAPPLPVGSSQVRIMAGQSPVEQGRMARAHKHHSPSHYKKDMTRDDTLDGTSSSRRYGSGADITPPGIKNTPR